MLLHDQPYRVPRPRRVYHALRWRVEPVVRAGGGLGRAAVGMAFVVEHLQLGPALPHPVDLFRHPEQHAAVAPFLDFPVQGQLEVPELFGGDDVAASVHAGEGSVDGLPPLRRALETKAAPPVRGGAVEQELPPCGALLGGQRIVLFLVGDGVAAAGTRPSQQSCHAARDEMTTPQAPVHGPPPARDPNVEGIRS